MTPSGPQVRFRRYGFRPTFHRTTATTTGDGAAPFSQLIADASGNLYGTTTAGGTGDFGTVFKLTKSATGFTESVLYRFRGSNDGWFPNGKLLLDKSGDIIGTTAMGGYSSDLGTVFKLTPYKTTYTFSVLYRFRGDPDGAFPNTGVLIDKYGFLYGSTDGGGSNTDSCSEGPNDSPGCGMVFRLSLTSAGYYRELIVDGFANDYGSPSGLIEDTAGNFYGTAGTGAGDFGEAFELSPGATPADPYTQKNIWASGGAPNATDPLAGLFGDSKGNLYGTTFMGGSVKCGGFGCGAVYRLEESASGGTYAEATLYGFKDSPDGSGPTSTLIADAKGNLYGTTQGGGLQKCYYPGTTSITGCGIVFRLTPNATATAYSYSILYTFKGGVDSGVPLEGLYIDSSGDLFGVTSGNGTSTDFGTVFQLTPAKNGAFAKSTVYTFKG
jgi:uncharacterized repeat protein (TIGR03803 family)